MKILITGGAGFIGVNISKKLLDRGYSVTIIDKLIPQIHGDDVLNSYLLNEIKDKVRFVFGDVNDFSLLKKEMQCHDILIHLAAETGTGQSMYMIKRYCDTNIVSTTKIIDILTNYRHSIKKVLYASSRAIYGEGMYNCKIHHVVYPDSRLEMDMKSKDFECKCPKCGGDLIRIPTNEDSLPKPSSLYGITKLTSEQLLQVQCKALSIPFVGFRMQNVYGEGQSLRNPYTGILSIFSTLLQKSAKINIFEDGNESRDFIHVSDVADAYILAIESNTIHNEIFNLGSGIPTSVMEIATKLKSLYNSKSKISVTGDFRIGDIRHNYADISKAKKILNWSPKIELEDGLEQFTKWVLTQKIDEINFQESIQEMADKGFLMKNVK